MTLCEFYDALKTGFDLMQNISIMSSQIFDSFLYFCCIFGAAIMVNNLFQRIANRIGCGKLNYLFTIIVKAIAAKTKSIATIERAQRTETRIMFLIFCQTTWINSLEEIYLPRLNIVIWSELNLQRIFF